MIGILYNGSVFMGKMKIPVTWADAKQIEYGVYAKGNPKWAAL